MVTHFPRTREAFGQIRGIGPAKTEKYADDFLPIIRMHIVRNMVLSEVPLFTAFQKDLGPLKAVPASQE